MKKIIVFIGSVIVVIGVYLACLFFLKKIELADFFSKIRFFEKI